MAKSYIFRIHKGQPANGNGWVKTNGIGLGREDNGIASIPDSLDKMPASGKIGTSIPTPLARMFLFKTAFELVSEHKGGVYDELVSDCLDILQLIFEKGGDASRFQFITWNADAEIRKLIDGNNLIQNATGRNDYNSLMLLADSLKMAVKSGANLNSENTSKDIMNTEITLVVYDGMLLGGTSPYTLFFTSPNLRRELQKRRSSASGYDFSSNKKVEFCGTRRIPLSKRPKEFQEYLRGMVKNPEYLANFATGAPLNSFGMYVNQQIGEMSYDAENYDENFKIIPNLVASGVPFRYNDKATKPENSHFMMRPSVDRWKKFMASEPLVLPSEFTSTGWIYIDDLWDTRTQIPDRSYKGTEIAARRLPKSGSTNGEMTTQKYPWVSNCDFLADKLIDLSYELNTACFFNNADHHPRFLLPIRKEYFMFFDLDDLRNNLKMKVSYDERKNDKNEIIDVKIKKVDVELVIPLKGAHSSISFMRTYVVSDTEKYTIRSLKKGFGLGLFPFYRLHEESGLKNQYSVYLFDAGQDKDAIKLQFFNHSDLDKPLTSKEELRTVTPAGLSKVYSLRSTTSSNSFDIIDVQIKNELGSYDEGLVVPVWGDRYFDKDHNNTETYGAILSIDFGTSNTHIAYYDPKATDTKVRPFAIPQSEQQLVLLNRPFEKDNVIDWRRPESFGRAQNFSQYLREFVPSVIGPGASVSYPVKTATLESTSSFSKGMSLFGNINVGYDIENEFVKISDSEFRYETDLKWALQKNRDNDRAKKRVEAFFQQTLWMLKNMIVIKGLYSKNIQIIYYYPDSMLDDDKAVFTNAWRDAVKGIFEDCGFSVKLYEPELESVAPYYSLLKRDSKLYAYNSVNIDIGGGTTDIFILDKKYEDKETGKRQRAFESSVYFAGNDIWDKTFPSGEKNGFVEYMKSMIEQPNFVISPESKKAYDNFSRKDKPAEMTSFFFKYKDFDYGGKIANNSKLRYVLFLHYASIIYYLSDMIKEIRRNNESAKFDLPSSLTFTGKGSEYIKIITPVEQRISEITLALFLAFGYDKSEFVDGFHVTYPENPKGLTAEGGVYKLINDDAIKVNMVPKGLGELSIVSSSIQRDVTEYENLGKKILGFETEPDKEYIIQDIKDYKGAVMAHFQNFIDSIFNSKILALVLSNLGMHLEEDDRKMTLEYAKLSFDMHAERYIREHPVRTKALEDNIFFLALKNTLIDLSLKYYEQMKK